MKWRENAAVKALAFMMAVVGFTAAAIMGWYQLMNYDVLWGEYAGYDAGPGEGYTVQYLEQLDCARLQQLLEYYNARDLGEELSAYLSQTQAALEERFDPSATNLRWQARSGAGAVRYGNAAGAVPARAQGLYWGSFSYREADGSTQWLELALWLDGDMAVDDCYLRAYESLNQWKAARGARLAETLLCAGAGLVLTVYLCWGCGHRRGREGISLNWFHRIPGDLLLVLMGLCAFLLLGFVWEGLRFSGFYGETPMFLQLLVVGAVVAAAAALGIGALVTFCARCKAHTLLRNTLIWRLCAFLAGLLRRVGQALPLVWKSALAGVGYLFFTVLTLVLAEDLVWMWLLGSAVCIVYLCLWACQWKRLRQGAREIIGGNAGYHIDTAHMLPDLRRHADELNNLGRAISDAVEDRMRSERFKAELITNVSHDIKTPLTSIISYVGLMKQLPVENPQLREYLDVLDRKSQRLKKLTEDLVEASKASTGNLTVSLEPIGLTELCEQALAEYEDRLAQSGLRVVRIFPEKAVWVRADGRHLWRVLDNLLSNCAKYALSGTRIYVEIRAYPDCGELSVKNISRDALNLPPEALLERFARGEESRTTEGSGLGLSIAQSLTELQGGRFDVSIDGDLFKATVTLPLAPQDWQGPKTP